MEMRKSLGEDQEQNVASRSEKKKKRGRKEPLNLRWARFWKFIYLFIFSFFFTESQFIIVISNMQYNIIHYNTI